MAHRDCLFSDEQRCKRMVNSETFRASAKFKAHVPKETIRAAGSMTPQQHAVGVKPYASVHISLSKNVIIIYYIYIFLIISACVIISDSYSCAVESEANLCGNILLLSF